jgi:hypothetical protein
VIVIMIIIMVINEKSYLYHIIIIEGDYEELQKSTEDWYTYRGLVTERLEVVTRQLAEREWMDTLMSDIETVEEIVVGSDEDMSDDD